MVAIAETHGRPHTKPFWPVWRSFPPRTSRARAPRFEEIDLAAVLARRPTVALPRRSRPPQRAGRRIGASAMAGRRGSACRRYRRNLDRLCRPAGIAERRGGEDRGIPHRETVPDPVVRAADEVELVDVAPQALQERLADGHIYPAERAGAALGSWFQTPNLSALRELALLWLVGKLASDRRRSRPGGQVPGDGHARERVVVALSGGPEGETLIRRAARIAAWSAGNRPCMPPGLGPTAAGRAALAAQRQLTVSLAAPTTSWPTPTSRPRCRRSPRRRTPLSWSSARPAAPGWPRRGPPPRSGRSRSTAAAESACGIVPCPPTASGVARPQRATYIGDTAPGQARGNNLNLNGGLWHEVPASR